MSSFVFCTDTVSRQAGKALEYFKTLRHVARTCPPSRRSHQVLPSFTDAEKTKMPRMLTATTWERVKADLCREVRKLTPRDR